VFIFFLLSAALFALPGFLAKICQTVQFLNCEPGTAIVVRNQPPVTWVEVEWTLPSGTKAKMPMGGVDPLPSYTLRYERLGKSYEKQIKTDWRSKDFYREGQEVPILFDPKTQEFDEPGAPLVGRISGILFFRLFQLSSGSILTRSNEFYPFS
jgi:hypothetical protein